MTYSKTLIVLAKSIKKRGFCIAGKEIETHKWVRPVKESPFSNDECDNLSNQNRPIKVLDIVEMTFIEKSPKNYQPENEKVDMNVRWRLMNNFQIENLDSLIDKYDFLDLIKNSQFHKFTLNSLKLQSSLQLIKLSKTNSAKIIYQLAYNQKYYRPKLQFNYKGISYTLPITDPTIPNSNQRKTPRNLENAYITIGIGEKFNNNHYILVVFLKEI